MINVNTKLLNRTKYYNNVTKFRLGQVMIVGPDKVQNEKQEDNLAEKHQHLGYYHVQEHLYRIYCGV